MTYPQVKITEYKDGPSPIRSRSFNRVACVGVSKKGKYRQFILVGSDDDLKNKVGKTLDTGSIGLQTSRDEGATDQGFVRVMGAARKASSFVTLAGTGTVSDTITLTVTDTK